MCSACIYNLRKTAIELDQLIAIKNNIKKIFACWISMKYFHIMSFLPSRRHDFLVVFD